MLGKVHIPSGRLDKKKTMIHEILRAIASNRNLCRAGVLITIEANFGRGSEDLHALINEINSKQYYLDLAFTWENDSAKSVGFCKTGANTEAMTYAFKAALEGFTVRFDSSMVRITGGDPVQIDPVESIREELFKEMAHWREDPEKKKISGKSYKNGDDMTVSLLEAYYCAISFPDYIKGINESANPKTDRRSVMYTRFFTRWLEKEQIQAAKRAAMN